MTDLVVPEPVPAFSDLPPHDLAAHAERYARLGRHVFPLRPRAKTPITTHGVKDATKDVQQVRRWWSRWPEANIGCAQGAVSGTWTLDVDGLEGEETLADLEREFGPLYPSIELITGNGRQIFFRYVEPVRNSVRKALGAGLDVRGDGGYTILPPSVHPTGRRYEWSVDGHPEEVPIVTAPKWLTAKMRANGNGAAKSNDHWRNLARDGAPEGERNDTAARLAGHLLRRHVDPLVTLELMQAWNTARCDPPLPPDEVERTVNSICRLELERRTGVQRDARQSHH